MYLELDYQDLENEGIHTEMIAVTSKLRKLAKLDRIRLDVTTHRSGLNKHLFEYIQYCGKDPLEFIKEYLSNLQPYMITRNKSQEIKDSYICVIDRLYRVSVYIKIDNQQFEEVIVSFHEDNKRGVAKTNAIQKIDNERRVAVFADCITSQVSNENKYTIKLFVQRGMLVLPLDLPAVRCKEVFIVEKRAIEMQLVSYCNDYIRDLYTSDLNLDFDTIEVFSFLQQISFTSYGRDTFSSVSLLIDSLCVQNDRYSKAVADMALITFIQNLQLTSEQRFELIELLETKFRVTSIKGIDTILERVHDALSVNTMQTTTEIESMTNVAVIDE